MSLRKDFQLDCCFGMPGINHLKQKDENDPDSVFISPASERTYQVWLRGRRSQDRRLKKVVKCLTNHVGLKASEYLALIQELKEIAGL